MRDSMLLSARDLDFLLHTWLRVEELTERPRFSEHTRETFDDVLALAQTLAEREFAPLNQVLDAQEPRMAPDGSVVHPDGLAEALAAYRDSGLPLASFDEEFGGLQLPATVTSALFAWFQAASVGAAAYPFLSLGNANLLLAHGTAEQIETYARPVAEGRWYGTMCLSEPQAGSSLGDITTQATPAADGTWRLRGTKMWISGGDQSLTENIVHLVLARTPDAPAGVKGISLFIVPKVLVAADGSLGERNDVVLAGLNHKMGYRGTTNTLLNFGEGAHTPGGLAGAVGHLVGEVGSGLAAMFHMMNEARVQVGLGAVALGYTGHLHALEYARTRTQGRPLGAKDPETPMVPIIGHTDVRRMLLASKSYVEGGLALSLYCSRLVDDAATHPSPEAAARAGLLLDVLTPIAKSWPSQWCLEANSLAIQVHGGYGYTRDFPVEQFYRDNRLNPIHEGTHGIQALDLLGRKLIADSGAGLTLLATTMTQTVNRARAAGGEAAEHAQALAECVERLVATTTRVWSTGDPALALANASLFLEAAGHVVVAWLWLDQLVAVTGDDTFARGKAAAARYFFRHELPRTGPQFDLLDSLDRTTLDLDPDVLG